MCKFILNLIVFLDTMKDYNLCTKDGQEMLYFVIVFLFCFLLVCGHNSNVKVLLNEGPVYLYVPFIT